jgi:hypothetical protein
MARIVPRATMGENWTLAHRIHDGAGFGVAEVA